MATLMEKDVLLEIIANGLGTISRKLNYKEHLNPNPDCDRLIEIRNNLYRTFPPEINYQKVLSECKSIQRKYEGS